MYVYVDTSGDPGGSGGKHSWEYSGQAADRMILPVLLYFILLQWLLYMLQRTVVSAREIIITYIFFSPYYCLGSGCYSAFVFTSSTANGGKG
jgi:hypothetical protein